jgi:hypothetical protein
LVSSGSSGFWFWSWVVSKVRKVWKLSAIPGVAVEAVVDFELVTGVATTCVGVAVSTDMAIS